MKGKLNKYLTQGSLLILILLILGGCKKGSELKQEEYIAFLDSPESGLNTSKTLNKISYNCRLQIPEAITLMRTHKRYETILDFNQDKKQYENQLNFILLIKDETNNNHLVKDIIFKKDEYGSLLSYANSELQNDFELELSNGELIPCNIVHLEPANSIQPTIRIGISFSIENCNGRDYTLIFNDNIFDSGKIKFRFEKGIFEELPQLKI